MPRSKIPAVILAGGASRRMGEDKALLPFGGFGSLAEYQYRRLKGLFPRVYLSAKEGKFSFDAPLLKDRSGEYSPLIALESILEGLEDEEIFVLGVDMPLLSLRQIQALLSFARSHPEAPAVACAGPGGAEPLCALYRRRILPLLKELLSEDTHRLRELLRRAGAPLLSVADPAELANLNRPEEYREAFRALPDPL